MHIRVCSAWHTAHGKIGTDHVAFRPSRHLKAFPGRRHTLSVYPPLPFPSLDLLKFPILLLRHISPLGLITLM